MITYYFNDTNIIRIQVHSVDHNSMIHTRLQLDQESLFDNFYRSHFVRFWLKLHTIVIVMYLLFMLSEKYGSAQFI